MVYFPQLRDAVLGLSWRQSQQRQCLFLEPWAPGIYVGGFLPCGRPFLLLLLVLLQKVLDAPRLPFAGHS